MLSLKHKGETNMKVNIINHDNLKESDMQETVTRVKVFLLNEVSNKFIVVFSNGGYQLPGGHVEENESLNNSIIREIAEETGIKINQQQITSSFYEIRHYTKKHRISGKKRISRVLYYFIKTKEKPNLNALNLTDNEKKNNFSLQEIAFEHFESVLQESINKSEVQINKIIEQEMLMAFKELTKQIV